LGQIKLVRKHLVNFYKYSSLENEAFKELLKHRSNFGLNFVSKKKELIARKEKLFTGGDLSKWEILPQKLKEYSKDELLKNRVIAYDCMLPKETDQVNESRDLFAFYNNTTFAELTRGFDEKCRAYAKNFHDFAKDQGDILNEVNHFFYFKTFRFI
jgi:hypothetical protein